MNTNCIIAQSGGPTAAINASLAGVISSALSSSRFQTIYGSIHGIEGIIQSNYLNLSDVFSQPESLVFLKNSPAMYLGSCRYKLPTIEEDISIYKEIFAEFNKMNISAFFYIGGNDSMDTVHKLSLYAEYTHSPILILGIPKTIDNDLCITDHTPGFGSAAKYVATSILEIAYDSFIYAPKSITIVEIMGRDAGWLTSASVLARNKFQPAPHLIYLPEVAFSKEQFIQDITNTLKIYSNIIIAVSEGIRDIDGNYISSSGTSCDNFGHQQLNGAAKTLEHIVKNHFSIKVRAIEINVLQRAAAHFASYTDLQEAFHSGEKAVDMALEGQSGCMVTMKRIQNNPYEISYESHPVSEIANQEKNIPLNWISDSKNDVKNELVEYLKPLILGEVQHEYIDGLPIYPDITHLI